MTVTSSSPILHTIVSACARVCSRGCQVALCQSYAHSTRLVKMWRESNPWQALLAGEHGEGLRCAEARTKNRLQKGNEIVLRKLKQGQNWCHATSGYPTVGISCRNESSSTSRVTNVPGGSSLCPLIGVLCEGRWVLVRTDSMRALSMFWRRLHFQFVSNLQPVRLLVFDELRIGLALCRIASGVLLVCPITYLS